MNKPVYDFIGYELDKCILNRDNAIAKQITISAQKLSFDLITHIYSFRIFVTIDFGSKEESRLEFLVKFLINDTSWYESVKPNDIASLFMSTAFPYVRQMINSITNDSRGPVIIPTLDLRGIILEKGIVLRRN